MYCGGCGSVTTADQKFCRVCGTNLLVTGSTWDRGPGQETTPPNKFFMGIEVVMDAVSRGVRYFLSTGTDSLEGADPRHHYMKWGFLLFWAGMAAGFLGRGGGIFVFGIGIAMMIYARAGRRASVSSARYESPNLRAPGTTLPAGWPSVVRDARGDQVSRQAPFPGQFAETSTIRLSGEPVPPKEPSPK